MLEPTTIEYLVNERVEELRAEARFVAPGPDWHVTATVRAWAATISEALPQPAQISSARRVYAHAEKPGSGPAGLMKGSTL
jgi:hypothetical protein